MAKHRITWLIYYMGEKNTSENGEKNHSDQDSIKIQSRKVSMQCTNSGVGMTRERGQGNVACDHKYTASLG
jgi:hypothetical protein